MAETVVRLQQKVKPMTEQTWIDGRETLTCPRLTPDAPAEQFQAVLRDHDKGQPVNAQDLVNALMWRVRNQRHEIAKLHERLRRKQSDEAPSFSPNFDERNGIR